MTIGAQGGNAPRLRIGFLFNHDMLHQVAHTAPIAAELLKTRPDVEVSILTSSKAQEDLVRAILARAEAPEPRYVSLSVPSWVEAVNAVARHVAPMRRIAVLRFNLDRFRQLDALVVPEKTSSMLRTRFGLEGVKLIHIPHGAGDRAVTFAPQFRDYDFILLSGEKFRERLLSLGHIEEGRYATIGYPKFDLMKLGDRPPPRLFDNDNPTVLYNPHFDPNLSSWYDWGTRILDFFAENPQYNLILAPHVMMFRRRWHVSLSNFRVRYRRQVPRKYLECGNILVDRGSASCIDMTYTMAADIYMGDASSQIYEFMARPRPALFLNPRGVDWQDDPHFAHWRYGDVLTDIDALGLALANAPKRFEAYRERQAEGFRNTFDLGTHSSSARAVRAITGFLEGAAPYFSASAATP